MSKSLYKELGISNREYEEALVLERLFKLVKKNPCSTCLLKKPTHVDLDRFELLCSTCSKRCSSKVQIGKGLISLSDLDRLESIYGKSKKKHEPPVRKSKKSHYRNKSTSPSSYDKSPDSYDSDSSYQPRRKSSSKKHRDRYASRDYPPDVYPTNVHKSRPDYYPSVRNEPDYYPKPAYPYKLQGKREIPGMVGLMAGRHDHTSKDDWPVVGSSEWVARRHDHRVESRPDLHRPDVHTRPELHNRPQWDERRVAPWEERMFSLEDQRMGNRMALGAQVGVPLDDRRGYGAPQRLVDRVHREPGALALTNGYPSIRSVATNNNPFAKRTGEAVTRQAFNFSGMREALPLPNPAQVNYRPIGDYQPRMPPSGNPYFSKFQ